METGITCLGGRFIVSRTTWFNLKEITITTIAYDGVTLATDSRITADGMIITDRHPKILNAIGYEYREVPLRYIAYAGAICDVQALLDWFRDPSSLLDVELGALMFTTDNSVYQLNCNGFYQCVDEPMSLGSGAVPALTAMRMGHTAVEAVKIAKKMDVYSGGRVQSVKIKTEDKA